MEKRGTFGIDEKVLVAIVRTAELFKRKSSNIFRCYGISFSQYNALLVLEIAPGGSKTLSEVSRQLLVSSPNMSGIAKRMEKAGFAVRRRDQADERKIILKITPKGRRVLQAIEQSQRENIRELLAGSPDKLKGEILEALKEILARN